MNKPLAGIIKKELAGHFHSLTAYVFIIVFLVSLTFLFFDRFFVVGQTSMRLFFALLPWFFLFLIPSLSMRVWAEEKRQGTYESLLTLPIADWQVVTAKFLSGFIFIGIVLLFSLPVPLTLAKIGDLDWGPVIGSYLGGWLLGGAYLALGQYVSSLTKNQIVAFLITIAASFLFLIVGFPFVLQKAGALGGILFTLSTMTHFDNMSKGVLDLRDSIYYLSFIALFLYLNYFVIVGMRHKLHSMARISIITVVIVFLNILISPFAIQYDLTEEKNFTMSKASKTIIKNLDNPVTIKAFVSQKIPETLFHMRQDLRDMLNDYDRLGGKNVLVEFLDPKNNPAALQEANSLGVREIQFNTFGAETFEISSGYLGLAILHEDKQEILPIIQNTDDLELEITSAILKMSREKTPLIGLTTGHGEDFNQPVRDEIARQYDVRDITTQDGQRIDSDIDILLIVGPTKEFTDRELFIIDQFVMAGKPLLVFADGVEINQQFFTGAPLTTKLNNVLTEYGITLNNDVAVDLLSQEALQFSSGFFVVIQPYPAWPKVVQEGIDKNHAITSRIRSITLPWPSTLLLTVTSDKKTKVSELLKTSPASYTLSGESILLNPEALKANPGTDRRPQVIAAVVQGKLQSAFTGKKIPANPKALNEQELILTQSDNATVLLAGSSRMLQTNIINQSPENFIFLGNALDTTISGQSLSEIRSRNSNARPIRALSAQKQRTIKYVNVFGGVAISLVVGLGAYVWRKRKDKKAELLYSDAS